jgi:hypothetical protein
MQSTSKQPVLPGIASVPDVDSLKHLLEASPFHLDWHHAIRIAAARLKESWLLPETGSDPAVAALAVELAGFLCAYGLLAEEVHRRARANTPAGTDRLMDEPQGGTFWSEPPGFATNSRRTAVPVPTDWRLVADGRGSAAGQTVFAVSTLN